MPLDFSGDDNYGEIADRTFIGVMAVGLNGYAVLVSVEADEEEREFYFGTMVDHWIDALESAHDKHKPGIYRVEITAGHDTSCDCGGDYPCSCVNPWFDEDAFHVLEPMVWQPEPSMDCHFCGQTFDPKTDTGVCPNHADKRQPEGEE